MLPKKGSSFPIGRVGLTEAEFAQVIASALKVEFGSAQSLIAMIAQELGRRGPAP